MLTCRDVAKAVGKDELRTGAWPTRVGLRFHLLMCRHCRRYAAQLRAIATAARTAVDGRADDPQVVERLRETVVRNAETMARSRDTRQ